MMNENATSKSAVRKLKIAPMYCPRAFHRSAKVPHIRISGKWLRAAGFDIGQEVTVECEVGRLIVRAVRENV